MRRLALILAMSPLATPAIAQTQAQMNASADAAYSRADATMTAQWKVTYARMKALDAADGSRGGGFGFAAALLESQRSWLLFRGNECVIEGAAYAGGSMQSSAQAQCRTRLTNERTRQLRELRHGAR